MQEPIRMHKDVWILHPEHHGTVVAKGRSGFHYKVAKSKLPRDRPCEIGIQWVCVQDVFLPGVAPMYASRQSHVRIMEDAMAAKDDGGEWIMWNTDFLLEVL